MATPTRFYNEGSSAGGTGTTNDTSGTNRAYASVIEWEAAEDGLSGSGDVHTLRFTGFDDQIAARLLLNGWASGVTFIFIANDSAEEANAVEQGAGFGCSSGSSQLSIIYFPAIWTQLRLTAHNSGNKAIQYSSGAEGAAHTYNNCYIFGDLSGIIKDGGSSTFNNTIQAGGGIDGTALVNGEDYNWNVFNCLFEERMIIRAYNTLNTKNSSFLATDWVLGPDLYAGTIVNVTKCLIAENAPAGDFNGIDVDNNVNQSFTNYFVDAANDDYNLTTNAADAIDDGVGTTDSDIPTTDANGVSRDVSTCDIGPFEFVAVGGGAIVNVPYMARTQVRHMIAR